MLGMMLGIVSFVVTAQSPVPVTTAKAPTPLMPKSGPVGTTAYPKDALRLRQEGTTIVALHVTDKGKVTACSIAESSGSRALDTESCAFARRLRFDPARDMAGRAIEGETRFPMAWRLPPQ